MYDRVPGAAHRGHLQDHASPCFGNAQSVQLACAERARSRDPSIPTWGPRPCRVRAPLAGRSRRVPGSGLALRQAGEHVGDGEAQTGQAGCELQGEWILAAEDLLALGGDGDDLAGPREEE